MKTRVTAIVINYRGIEDTIACVRDLLNQAGELDTRVIVVDNASNDGSVERLREEFGTVDTVDRVTLLESATNTGFCGGNNLGIQTALNTPGDFVFLVNNDTVIPEDCLQKLVTCAQILPDLAILSPAIYHYSSPNMPWFTGGVLNGNTWEAQHLHRDVRAENLTAPYESDWANGCAVLIPYPVMQALQGFDERFFCYWEDVELSLRAKALGYGCCICPSAYLLHKVGATIRKQKSLLTYYMVRNHLLLTWKLAPRRTRVAALLLELKFCLKGWRRYLLRHPGSVDSLDEKARTIAIWDFFMSRTGPCRYRWIS